MSLVNYFLWQQEIPNMFPDMTLVEHCQQGERLVQVSLEVRLAVMIYILDIPKPVTHKINRGEA